MKAIYRSAELVALVSLWALVALGVTIAIAGSILAFGWFSLLFWFVAGCLFVTLRRPPTDYDRYGHVEEQ